MWLLSNGQDCGKKTNMSKLLAAEASWEAAEATMQTWRFSLAEEYNIEKIQARRIRCSCIYKYDISIYVVLDYMVILKDEKLL